MAKTSRLISAGRPPKLDTPNKSATQLNVTAYHYIKRDIILCTYAPNEEITESQLASAYGLGKMPIRSALSRLRQEGFVLPMARQGYRIAPVTIRDVQEMYQLRLMLEPQSARLAAGKVDEAHLNQLQAEVEIGYTPADKKSQASFLEANRRFHIAIAEATGNRRLARLVTQLLEEADRILHLGLALGDHSYEFQHGHRQLIAALVANDPDQAEQLLIEGITGSRDLVLQALLSDPTVLEVSLVPSKGSPARRGAPQTHAWRDRD